MIKNYLPLIVIIGCIIMIIINTFTTDGFDNGFWMQTLSSALLIFAMLATIYNRKKQ